MRTYFLKYRSLTFLIVFLFFTQKGWTQQVELSLEQCQKEVQQNYPIAKAKQLLEQSSSINLENLKTGYLPQLFANGKVTYQSDVTGISLPGIEAPKAPKDQYSLNVDVEQLIYNGGRIKSQMKLEKMASAVAVQNIEVQMYQLREKVNAAYFSILLIRKNRNLLHEKYKTIQARLDLVRSAVANGSLLSANQKILESELLLIDQQNEELKAAESSAFGVLSQLMGRELKTDLVLEELPVDETEINKVSLRSRPEYQWYDNQKLLLDEQINLTQKNRLPSIKGFGQMGYGKPGYNQLNDSFDTYYMIGAKLSWNIFDWKTSRRKQKNYSLQKDLVTTQELSFVRSQNIELEQEANNINKFKLLLVKDDAIIELQEDISKSSASQLDHGVITSSDYLDDLNKEIQAKLNRDYHLVQLQQSVAEYKRIKGLALKK